MSIQMQGDPEDIDRLEKLLNDARKDRARLDWLESQQAHVFDKGQGDFRFYWRKSDGKTVRETIDEAIEQDRVYGWVK